MIWVDYVFIGIVLISILVGALRGLVREALSLVAWILAFVAALRYGPPLAEHLKASIETPVVRTAAAYALVFFGVLLAGGLLTWLATSLVKNSGMGGVDRMLGAGFGLFRGVLIVVAVVLLAGASAAKHDAWWRHSLLVPKLEPLADALGTLIPERWFAYLRPQDASSNPKSEQ